MTVPGDARFLKAAGCNGHSSARVFFDSGAQIAGNVGEFIGEDDSLGWGNSRKDRRFRALNRNILPGTSEQTQDHAILTPRDASSYCGTKTTLV